MTQVQAPRRGFEAPVLLPVSGRLPLPVYVQRLWDTRHFIRTQAFAKATTQNTDMLLGNLWLALSPLLDALFYFVLFGLILKVNRGVANFPAYIVIGISLYSYTIRAVTGGGGIIRANMTLARAFTFPRMAFPLSTIMRDAVTMTSTLGVMIAFILIVPPHAFPRVTWILLPVILVLQTLLNTGLTLLVARITHWVPDLRQIINFFMRFMMYASGVLFPLSRFINHPVLLRIIEGNPLYQLIDMARKVLLDGVVPPQQSWLILTSWSLGVFVVGFLVFWQGEANYGREGH